nr:VWA domain-containing protein [Ardenticatena sp.]
MAANEKAGESPDDGHPLPQRVPERGGEDSEDGKGRPVRPSEPLGAPRLAPDLDRRMRRRAGKRTTTRTNRKRGRYIKARPARDRLDDIAFDATLRAAAPHQRHRKNDDLAVHIRREEVQRKVRVRRTSNLILFVVDASWSMAASERMEATKGAILGLLMDAYQKRDQVGMVVFQRNRARVVLPPTNSVELARKALEEVPVGGKTPLSSGLYTTFEIVERERRRNPEVVPLVVLLTDGAGNVSMGSMPPQQEALQVARLFKEHHIPAVVVNTEHEAFDRGLAQQLADEMGAECLKLKDFSPDALTSLVHRYTR